MRKCFEVGKCGLRKWVIDNENTFGCRNVTVINSFNEYLQLITKP